jgi:hypothetical protein
MGTRLDRGRTYANTGKVLSLTIEPGRAFAKVKGNYRPSYQVEIIFPPLKEAEKVYKMIEDTPTLLARIAAGELPESFLYKLKDNGMNLIPRHWQEMKRTCTCPDEYGNPCKHVAALYYIIAREIDADPHVLFRLRGMDLSERFGKNAVHAILPPFKVLFNEDDNSNRDFSSLEQITLEEIPYCTDLITALLPSSPAFSRRNFAVVMAEFYHRSAHYKAWESAEAEINSQMEHSFSRSTWSILCSNPAPGAEVFLDAEDINGDIRRFTIYDAFEHFVYFSSEDGTASYNFLFFFF